MRKDTVMQIVIMCVAAIMVVSPVDIVPDILPVIGYLDDVIYILVGARQAMNMITAKGR